MAENEIKKLKKILFMHIYTKNTLRWVDQLADAVKKTNNTVLSTTKLTPSQMLLPKNAEAVREKFDETRTIRYSNIEKQAIKNIKVGDNVRISRKKGIFERFYDPNWSADVFTVTSMSITEGIPLWHLKYKESGEEVKGSFYANEMKKVLG